jgi:hypothetical protein
MAHDHPTWGQERMANELLLKLGLQVFPCTVRKHMGDGNQLSDLDHRVHNRLFYNSVVAMAQRSQGRKV